MFCVKLKSLKPNIQRAPDSYQGPDSYRDWFKPGWPIAIGPLRKTRQIERSAFCISGICKQFANIMEQISANESGTIDIGQNEFFTSIDNLVKAKEFTEFGLHFYHAALFQFEVNWRNQDERKVALQAKAQAEAVLERIFAENGTGDVWKMPHESQWPFQTFMYHIVYLALFTRKFGLASDLLFFKHHAFQPEDV